MSYAPIHAPHEYFWAVCGVFLSIIGIIIIMITKPFVKGNTTEVQVTAASRVLTYQIDKDMKITPVYFVKEPGKPARYEDVNGVVITIDGIIDPNPPRTPLGKSFTLDCPVSNGTDFAFLQDIPVAAQSADVSVFGTDVIVTLDIMPPNESIGVGVPQQIHNTFTLESREAINQFKAAAFQSDGSVQCSLYITYYNK